MFDPKGYLALSFADSQTAESRMEPEQAQRSEENPAFCKIYQAPGRNGTKPLSAKLLKVVARTAKDGNNPERSNKLR